MGVYSDSVTRVSAYTCCNFFDTLMSCLRTVQGSVENLGLVSLMTEETPAEGQEQKIGSIDHLLVYQGVPLLAIAIRVEGASVNTSVRKAIAQAVKKKEVKALGLVKQAVADRLKAADAEETPVVEEPVVTRVMTELCWRITLRSQTGDERVFEGGPFDFAAVESAFDAIADVVEGAIKAAKQPAKA